MYQNNIQDPKPKSLLIILMFLLLLLLAIGVINYYYVKEIDSSYSDLIENSVQTNIILQEISRNNAKIRSNLRELVRTDIPVEQNRIISEINRLTSVNNYNYLNLDSLSQLHLKVPRLEKLINSRLDYLNTRDSLFSMMSKYPLAVCSLYYRNVVRNKIEIYNDELLSFAYQVKYSTFENSDSITRLSNRISQITFGLIFAPIVLIVIGIFYIILILYRSFNDTHDY